MDTDDHDVAIFVGLVLAIVLALVAVFKRALGMLNPR